MKVYFTASSSGSHKNDRENYLSILRTIDSLSHTITNPYYASLLQDKPSKQNEDFVKESDDVFRTLRKKILESDCVIAEISVPSTSLGIQIEFALNNKIPVLCLCPDGENGDLPLLVRDYEDPLLTKKSYTKKNVEIIVKNFLKNFPKTRIKFNMFLTHELDRYLSHLVEKGGSHKSEIMRNLLREKMKTDKEYSF